MTSAILMLTATSLAQHSDLQSKVYRPVSSPHVVGGALHRPVGAGVPAGGFPNLAVTAVYVSTGNGEIIQPTVGHRFWVRVEFSYENPVCTPYAVGHTVNGFSNTAPTVNWGCGESGVQHYWHNWGAWLIHKEGAYFIEIKLDADDAIAESAEEDNLFAIQFDFTGGITAQWALVQVEEGRDFLGPGTDVIVGTMDDAFDFLHPWLNGSDSMGRPRLVAANQNALGIDGSPINASHATSLMGIVLARGYNDGDITGFAPDARYVSAEFINRQNIPGHPVLHAFDAAGFLVEHGVEVINMSWSRWIGTDVATQLGETSNTNLMADYLSYDRNIVCVAGVNQLDDFDRPTAPGSSRNVITVGGLHADMIRAWSQQDHGPTLDGRSKPDLLGNDSENAVALDPAWREGFPAAEGWWGTSYSAPFVTGAVAQMLGYGKLQGESTDHRVIKAIVMNSGVKTVNSLGQPWAAAAPAPLDAEQGTGILNMVRVYEMYSAGQQPPGAVHIPGYDLREIQGVAGVTQGRIKYRLGTPIGDSAAFDATLTWDRHTFWGDENFNERIDAADFFYTLSTDVQDNLDLVLYRDGLPLISSLSTVDNVEHLYSSGLPPGLYELAVERRFLTNSGTGETYALAWHSPHGWAFADADADGDCDLADAAVLMRCFDQNDEGPCNSASDFDRDGHTGTADHRILWLTLTGP